MNSKLSLAKSALGFTILSLFISSTFAQLPKKVAFVVGVSDYQKKGLDPLNFAHKDAVDVANFLSQNGFQVTKFIGPDSKHKTVRSALSSFLDSTSALGKQDIVVIYFSGHGIQKSVPKDNKKVESPFLCVYDTLTSDPSTMISLNTILEGLDEKSGSTNNLLIVDACRSNKGDKKLDGSRVIELPYGISMLLSCSSGQESYEANKTGNVKQGIFTHVLIEGLKGAAKNGSDEIDWLGLVAYAVREVPKVVKELKGDSFEQKPNLVNNTVDSPALARYSPPQTIENSIGMKFQLVVPNDNSKLSFYLGASEVTQSQFESVMKKNPSAHCKTGKAKAKVAGIDTSNFPVENVTWQQAVEFYRKLNKLERHLGRKYRLPSLSEWRAAATKPSEYAKQVWFANNTIKATPPRMVPRPAGTSQPDENGIYDMLGNVWEWCDSDQVGNEHPYCGGSIFNGPDQCHPNSSVLEEPNFKSRLVGFRVLLEK